MRRRLFLLLVASHAVVLFAWAGWLEWGRAAVPIRLEVVQFDPRDLLRGDYIQLRYAAARIPSDLYMGTVPPRVGGPMWVVLEPASAGWRPVRAAPSREALTVASFELAMAGTVKEVTAGGAVVDYGIERYYVPEGKGVPPRGRMHAEVAVGADGRAHLLRLVVDGRSYP